MNEASLKLAQEAFMAGAGFQPDLNTPITQAEATALRDRHKSMMGLLSSLQEHLGKLDAAMWALKSRADDADETAKQLKSLVERVSEMAVSQKDLTARVVLIEDKLGIVRPDDKKPKAKKKS